MCSVRPRAGLRLRLDLGEGSGEAKTEEFMKVLIRIEI